MNKILETPILITGAAGFIGSNLTRSLLTKGFEVNIIIRNKTNTWRINDIIKDIKIHTVDLSDEIKVRKIINQIKPRTIFHLAAYGAYPYQNEMEVIKLINLDCTINLLKACENVGFKIFVNTGSNSEYGIKNSAMKESDLLKPNSYYSVFKSAATLYCQYESITKKIPIITLRPFHVYGPYEEKTRFVPVLIANLLKGKCPPLVSPNIKRDMIYINDAIDFYITVAKNKIELGGVYNLGTGIEYSIQDIVNTAIDIIGVDVEPSWNTMENRSWDHEKWKADMTLVKNTYKWVPKINLFNGLEKTIQWYNQLNYDK